MDGWRVPRWSAFLLLGALAVLGAACDDGDSDGVGVTGGLVRCKDCGDVEGWVKGVALAGMEKQLEQNLQDTLDAWRGVDDGGDDVFDGDDDEVSDDDGAPSDDDADQNGEGDDDDDADHSDTNVQEEGVDEADIVKTNGDLLFITTGGYLLVFDADPANQTHELSRVDIEGTVREMFLYENVVLVFSSLWNYEVPENVWPDLAREDLEYDLAKLTIVDVSTPDAPVVLREMYLEGVYQSSRRVDASARAVIYGQATIPGVEYYVDPYEAGCVDEETWEIDEQCLIDAYERLAEQNREIIENTPYEEWLPRYFDIRHLEGGDVNESGILSDCVNFYHPMEYFGTGVLSVVTVVLTDPMTRQPDVSVIADGQIVYASQRSLYVAGSPQSYQAWMEWEDGYADEVTQVHKFDIGSDPTQALYKGSGEVEGWVLNQFSMSEYDGVFRIATTVGRWGDAGTRNFVFCLVEDAGALVKIGELRDIAAEEAEQLYAVRFLGDKGYLVTFRQTDPLWIVDLSDPTEPRLRGELQVPGYSTYLHPMDETHLIAVGVGQDEWGGTSGIELSLFDVSDLDNPTRLFNEPVGGYGAYSDAQYNHKAFLYYPDFEMLVIPVVDYGWYDDDVDDDWTDDDAGDDDDQTEPGVDAKDAGDGPFSGFYVFHVTAENGFYEEGTVDHTGMQPEEGSDPHYYDPYPQRSVVIGTALYTLSDVGLVVVSLPDLAELAQIPLPYEERYPEGDDDVVPPDDDVMDDDDDDRVPPDEGASDNEG